MICVIFVQFAEQKKQSISDIKAGIDEAEALVPSSLFSFCWTASFLSSVLWDSDIRAYRFVDSENGSGGQKFAAKH